MAAREKPEQDARPRHDVRALEELLASQRRRIGRYTARADRRTSRTPRPHPNGGGSGPADVTAEVAAIGTRDLLDALPLAALLIRVVRDGGGRIADYHYVTENEAAVRYADAVIPREARPPSALRPVPLFDRFPSMADTPVPRMLRDAFDSGRPQGPEPVEWYLPLPDGQAVRIHNEVTVTRCGEHLLLSWERGHHTLLARAAQQLARVCWAEWNLGDDTAQGSEGLRHVLGLPADAPVPTLPQLAAMTTAGGPDALHRALYDVFLRRRRAACDLVLADDGRVLSCVAEPVWLPGGPVWSVRAVMMDVTGDRRARERAAAAELDAQAQRAQVHALADISGALRDAVLPHFEGELSPYGLEAAAVYRPDSGSGVGGDWFKVRVLPGDRVLIALGDARGHGLQAVTLMAKLRYALAGLSFTGRKVEQLTAWLNNVACDDGRESTATAVIGRYHPERCLLRWTCAGHPRPVLLRDGRARVLWEAPGAGGPPLGVVPDQEYRATETVLLKGDVVLLYSDGLVERRAHDPDADTARLVEEVARAGGHGVGAGPAALERFAQTVVQALTGPRQTDDATLLAFRHLHGEPDRPR
ncbi:MULTISPECIES: PP2C family protein-serine/threonine phosphatase [Streptomyces]|uniref:PP2C family protein-serine/threonine phosphatase n=1 Tax=Streptomyces doudnae TaxID=3075536 RepID=A0ABD5EMH5_9ACTN|nr:MULTISPECIES: PP2C family protein-serine/threonine phosphatase [unclassified Streptomyces]MDT0435477.1 PP2C family protein-serine/threonine phosphatase [Streptomyces sp. DSM 41981]MYQ63721.1 SpoIIE family protein phosphatase [Streptomyces sp. SID4950]